MMVEISPRAADDDKGHSGLDEPPCQEGLLTDAHPAIGVAQGIALLGNVERALDFARDHHVVRHLGVAIRAFERARPIQIALQAVELAS